MPDITKKQPSGRTDAAPINPLGKRAIAIRVDEIVDGVKDGYNDGHLDKDDLLRRLEYLAAAKKLSTEAYEKVRDFVGDKVGESRQLASGATFTVKGGKNITFDYSGCQSIARLLNERAALKEQMDQIDAMIAARKQELANIYAQNNGSPIESCDPETGELYVDVLVPKSGSTYSFELSR